MKTGTEFCVVVVETPSLGDRSYVVHDGSVGVVIDPQRDIDRLLAEVDAASLRLTHVLETHVHNDYVSGGLALSRRTGAEYVICADDGASFERRGVTDGDEIVTGSLTIRAVHTPGHTHTHLSYVVFDGAGEPRAVFTGGSLLYGTVGRTDLIGEADTEELTRAQYRSGRRLVEELPDTVAVYPTHGFGSFCASSGGGDRTAGTIADERTDNLVVTIDDEDRFVERLLAGLTEHPAYYAHMSLLNLAGPLEASLAPPVPVEADELRRRVEASEWVVDLRSRKAFAADHVAGSISVELDDPFSTYIGWLIPWGSRLTLIATTAGDVAAAQRQLVRIGIDQLGGAVTGELDEAAAGVPRAAYRITDFAGLAAAMARGEPLVVVDVRRRDEWRSGHVEGARNIPLHELVARHHHVPEGELWVHCASGYRAAIAASLLARARFPVVLVDGEFDRAEAAGLKIATAS